MSMCVLICSGGVTISTGAPNHTPDSMNMFLPRPDIDLCSAGLIPRSIV